MEGKYFSSMKGVFILSDGQGNKRIQDFIKKISFPFISLIFLIAFYLNTRGMRKESVIYPKIIMAVLLGFIVINVLIEVKDLVGKKSSHKIDKKDPIKKKNRISVPIIFLTTFLYVLLIPYLGFGVSTILYLMGMVVYLGVRNIYAFIYVAIVFGFVYGLFEIWLRVRLPKGIFF